MAERQRLWIKHGVIVEVDSGRRPGGGTSPAAGLCVHRLFGPGQRPSHRMQFTFKREAVAMAVFLVVPVLLGLLVAVVIPLFWR